MFHFQGSSKSGEQRWGKLHSIESLFIFLSLLILFSVVVPENKSGLAAATDLNLCCLLVYKSNNRK